MKNVRELPADVYDALELSAEAFGGIGAGDYADAGGIAPLCIHGHAASACGGKPWDWTFLNDAIGITTGTNDDAVRAIQKRRGRRGRVSFADYCAELGITRGAP